MAPFLVFQCKICFFFPFLVSCICDLLRMAQVNHCTEINLNALWVPLMCVIPPIHGRLWLQLAPVQIRLKPSELLLHSQFGWHVRQAKSRLVGTNSIKKSYLDWPLPRSQVPVGHEYNLIVNDSALERENYLCRARRKFERIWDKCLKWEVVTKRCSWSRTSVVVVNLPGKDNVSLKRRFQ